jgi:shikimate dehydrogenase
MSTYGLIGYPLGHSFSKKFFTEKFEKEGLTDCKYLNFEIEIYRHVPHNF